jgi:hypothetical protein
VQVIVQSAQQAPASLPVVLAPLLNVFPLHVKESQVFAEGAGAGAGAGAAKQVCHPVCPEA